MEDAQAHAHAASGSGKRVYYCQIYGAAFCLLACLVGFIYFMVDHLWLLYSPIWGAHFLCFAPLHTLSFVYLGRVKLFQIAVLSPLGAPMGAPIGNH